MGSGRGVEVRGHSIRIGFTFDGEYVKERLTANGQALPPTPKNIAYAERVAATVRDRIRHGTFVLADFFPDSPRAAGAKQEKLTVSKLAELYLASVEGLSPATVSQYANAINNTWVRCWARRRKLTASLPPPWLRRSARTPGRRPS